MNREALDELKQQIRLLEYLQAHDWQPARQLSRGRLMGLCPLHADHKPSFLVDPSKTWIRRENAASGPKGLQLSSSREYRFCEAFYHR